MLTRTTRVFGSISCAMRGERCCSRRETVHARELLAQTCLSRLIAKQDALLECWRACAPDVVNRNRHTDRANARVRISDSECVHRPTWVRQRARSLGGRDPLRSVRRTSTGCVSAVGRASSRREPRRTCLLACRGGARSRPSRARRAGGVTSAHSNSERTCRAWRATCVQASRASATRRGPSRAAARYRPSTIFAPRGTRASPAGGATSDRAQA